MNNRQKNGNYSNMISIIIDKAKQYLTLFGRKRNGLGKYWLKTQ